MFGELRDPRESERAVEARRESEVRWKMLPAGGGRYRKSDDVREFGERCAIRRSTVIPHGAGAESWRKSLSM